jgi:acyl-ACP thioesterase
VNQEDIIYKTNYKVRACEVNFNHKITFPALVQLFQEASLENIIELKLASWDDDRGDFGWVLLRKEITVIHYPSLGEDVIIETCPSGFERIFAYRDYKMFDNKNRLIAFASSTWTYMDLNTRKLASLPESLEFFDASRFREVLPRPKSKIAILKEPTHAIDYVIRRYHLDWNGHVNNNHYFKFVLEVIDPPEIFMQPSKVILHIKSECLNGEKISVQAKQRSDETLVTILKNEKELVACAIIEW